MQPEKIELVLSHGDVNHKITGLVGAITIENPEYRSLKIYCLYSPELNISDIDGNSYQILPTNQMIQDFGNQLIWIHDIQEFRRRVEAKIEKNADLIKHYKGDSVVYFDHQHHGHFDQNNVPFRKHQKFSLQKEFRIVLKTMDDSESPFVLDIGDIRDICTEMDASDFDENKMEISILQNPVH